MYMQNRIHQKCCGSSSLFSRYHKHSCANSSCQLPTCALKQTCQALSCLAPLRPVLEVPSTMLWTPQSYNDLTCSSVVLDLIFMSFHPKDATKSTERNTRKENSGTFSHLSFFLRKFRSLELVSKKKSPLNFALPSLVTLNLPFVTSYVSRRAMAWAASARCTG